MLNPYNKPYKPLPYPLVIEASVTASSIGDCQTIISYTDSTRTPIYTIVEVAAAIESISVNLEASTS